MNTRIISFIPLLVLAFSPCCRPKAVEKASPSAKQGNYSEKNTAQLDSESSVSASRSPTHFPPEKSQKDTSGAESDQLSYVNLKNNLDAFLAKIPPPRTTEEYEAALVPYRNMLDHRRDLLFSIPVSPKAEKDRKDAWDALEFKKTLAIFSYDQNDYAKKLLNYYSTAPEIEKLVMWEVVRTRMEYGNATNGRRGLSGNDEILLRREMAKLLFSALGLEKQELFDAVNLKTRSASNEAEMKGSAAEEEIERLHIEQSKVAEKILEEHWKLPQ
ncbi:hypothetical protein [Luteolibacter sp.]|uniref:hypothetical protein n=1 Tax=Luteolibacter sp. TaxID=1962973 RepID=UPI0032656BE8